MARMDVARIVVTGVSGAGKTVVGSALADRLGMPFCDADSLHAPEAVAKMAAGTPLTDADRIPWLERVGDWLASVEQGVIACSALRRSYRDLVRSRAPGAFFVQLTGSRDLLASRLANRRGHFMPATLLSSQLATLEPLAPDEPGLVVNVAPPVDVVVASIAQEL